MSQHQEPTPEEFIANSGWRYAKTMPECPHEYTVRDLSPGGAKTTAMGDVEFESFVRLIRAKGTRKRWGPYNHTYLIVGEWEYWTMGEPPAETTIINRQAVGPNARKELAERIGAR